MAGFISAAQLRSMAMQDYPDWAGDVEYSNAVATARTELKNGKQRRYTEYTVSLRHRGLSDSRTIVARTPTGFGNKLDRLFEAWDKQWRVAKRVGGVGRVSTHQQGTKRGGMYVQVVYLSDPDDAAEIDIVETIRHNGLRKPQRGAKNLQHAYIYRWPFAQKPQRGHLVIGSGALAVVTRLSRSGSDYHGCIADLDAFIGGDAATYSREQLVDLVGKVPRGSLDEERFAISQPTAHVVPVGGNATGGYRAAAHNFPPGVHSYESAAPYLPEPAFVRDRNVEPARGGGANGKSVLRSPLDTLRRRFRGN
ncbi:hypothetical protein [Demequina gelatinilytica]|uniref:hypothetical protein n=1 Tax=Demequina gelatinilytica TaxID=1638980 RepID=UPI0007861D24|nr:hypothetical protein [Demequina gelatinilytica]